MFRISLKRLIFALIISAMVFACSGKKKNSEKTEKAENGINQLTLAEKKAGWKLLFDGKSFKGWRGLGMEGIPGRWYIKDGELAKHASGEVKSQADGQPVEGGDLMTIDTYRDFEFAFEWKISPAGNSGVKYNVSEELSTSRGPSHAALGWEYQVLDDNGHPDNLNPTHRAGSLYDMIEATGKTLKPVGEWNTSKIVFVGNHGEHWLNGKKVVEFDLGTAHFDSLYAKSKYFKIPHFADRRSGHIVLQDHKDAVWYRNLRIRVVNP